MIALLIKMLNDNFVFINLCQCCGFACLVGLMPPSPASICDFVPYNFQNKI